jgi:hypothetical protein
MVAQVTPKLKTMHSQARANASTFAKPESVYDAIPRAMQDFDTTIWRAKFALNGQP